MIKKATLGINFSSVPTWSQAMPFNNLFKMSRPWMTLATRTRMSSTGEEDFLQLDENGYPTILETNYKYKAIGRIITSNFLKTGTYQVTFDGEGEIVYNGVTELISSREKNKHLIQLAPNTTRFFLNIVATNPNNHLRNISIVHTDDVGNTFNPKYVDFNKDFKVCRFMDWNSTNNSKVEEWSERKTLEWVSYRGGVPYEVMIEYCNLYNKSPWFCIPHRASNDYVDRLATLIKDTLDPLDKEVYIEYSNEFWNGNFEQSAYCKETGTLLNLPGTINAKAANFYSKRAVEVIKILKNKLSGFKVVGVLGGQASNTGVINRILRYEWSSTPLTHQTTGIDAIAIAPYFGILKADHPKMLDVANLPNELKWSTLNELVKQGMQRAINSMRSNKRIAVNNKLRLLCYEAGQHLADKDNDYNPKTTDMQIEFNKRLEMKALYEKYLNDWNSINPDVMCLYFDIGSYNKFGSWGLVENINQTSSAKYDAVKEFLTKD